MYLETLQNHYNLSNSCLRVYCVHNSLSDIENSDKQNK